MQRHFKQRWTDIPSYSKWSLEYRYPNTGSDAQAAVEALPKFIQILAPLDHDARERAIGAAMILLGDNPAKSPRKNDATKSVEEGTPTEDVNGISAKASAWVKKHGIVREQLHHIFSSDQGIIDVIAAKMPGTSKHQQTVEA